MEFYESGLDCAKMELASLNWIKMEFTRLDLTKWNFQSGMDRQCLSNTELSRLDWNGIYCVMCPPAEIQLGQTWLFAACSATNF